MMTKFIYFAISAILTILVLLPSSAHAADLFQEVCSSDNTSQSAVCQDKNNQQNPNSNSFYGKDGILIKAARIVTIIVGIASVIMIIIGGFKYTTSGGDPNNVNSAKNTILYAVIGLVVALVAEGIIQFTIGHL